MATKVERRHRATLIHEGWARGHLRPLDIRKGDNVEVISGKDKGKRGVVERVLPEQQRVAVRGVNLLKRHTKSGVKGNIQGGIVDFDGPVAIQQRHARLQSLRQDDADRARRQRARPPRDRVQEVRRDVRQGAGVMAVQTAELPRMQRRYIDEIVPTLVAEFRYLNAMQVPSIEKVVVNIGLGEAITNPRAIDAAIADLKLITGQAPIVIRAKKSVAAFKLREGMPIGVKVTLRGRRMFDFLDKLLNVALPAFETSAVSIRRRSTAMAITPSGCASNSSFRRSTTTRSTSFAGSRCAS